MFCWLTVEVFSSDYKVGTPISFILLKDLSESCSVMSNSLQSYGLYSPWNSPGQNTGVGIHYLLQGSSQPKDRTQVPCMASRASLATMEAQEYWNLPLSSGSSWPRNQTRVYCIADPKLFTIVYLDA